MELLWITNFLNPGMVVSSSSIGTWKYLSPELDFTGTQTLEMMTGKRMSALPTSIWAPINWATLGVEYLL